MKKSVLIPYERYLYYKGLQNNPQISEENTNKEISPPKNDIRMDSEPDKLRCEVILSLLPKRNHSKAAAFLSFIDQHPTLDWNHKGELVVDKITIPFSHITDLTHDAINPTKSYDPVGCEEFYSNIGHVPVSLIRNPKRRSMLGGRELPPPGIPDKKPIHLSTWKELWKTH